MPSSDKDATPSLSLSNMEISEKVQRVSILD